MLLEEIELIGTCGACPEQYDVRWNGEKIAYMRLRHGYFYAEASGKVVYEANTIGDGLFDQSERAFHLDAAKKAIVNYYTPTDDQIK